MKKCFKSNGVGKESFAATWTEHPFMIEGKKIRQRNVLYFKICLILSVFAAMLALQ